LKPEIFTPKFLSHLGRPKTGYERVKWVSTVLTCCTTRPARANTGDGTSWSSLLRTWNLIKVVSATMRHFLDNFFSSCGKPSESSRMVYVLCSAEVSSYTTPIGYGLLSILFIVQSFKDIVTLFLSSIFPFPRRLFQATKTSRSQAALGSMAILYVGTIRIDNMGCEQSSSLVARTKKLQSWLHFFCLFFTCSFIVQLQQASKPSKHACSILQ